MKRIVVVNEAGDILATGLHPSEGTSGDNPPHGHGFAPLEGQQVHEVEFPDGASLEDIMRHHTTHRVRVQGGTARLERR